MLSAEDQDSADGASAVGVSADGALAVGVSAAGRMFERSARVTRLIV